MAEENLFKFPETATRRPIIGKRYLKKGTTEIYEVRSIAQGFVVCSRQAIFTRDEFANEFREFDVVKGWPIP